MSNKENIIQCFAQEPEGCIQQEGYELLPGEKCTNGKHELFIQPNIRCVNMHCLAKAKVPEGSIYLDNI